MSSRFCIEIKLVGWYGGRQMRLASLKPAGYHSLITAMMTIQHDLIRIVCETFGDVKVYNVWGYIMINILST